MIIEGSLLDRLFHVSDIQKCYIVISAEGCNMKSGFTEKKSDERMECNVTQKFSDAHKIFTRSDAIIGARRHDEQIHSDSYYRKYRLKKI